MQIIKLMPFFKLTYWLPICSATDTNDHLRACTPILCNHTRSFKLKRLYQLKQNKKDHNTLRQSMSLTRLKPIIGLDPAFGNRARSSSYQQGYDSLKDRDIWIGPV